MSLSKIGSGTRKLYSALFIISLFLIMFVGMIMCTGLVELPFNLLFQNTYDRRKVAFWTTNFTVLPFLVSLFLFVNLCLFGSFMLFMDEKGYWIILSFEN